MFFLHLWWFIFNLLLSMYKSHDMQYECPLCWLLLLEFNLWPSLSFVVSILCSPEWWTSACIISHSLTVMTLQRVPSSLQKSDIAPLTFTDYGREKIISSGFTAYTRDGISDQTQFRRIGNERMSFCRGGCWYCRRVLVVVVVAS